MTVTDCPALPPVPVQVKIKVLVVVNGPTVSLPELAFVPDQASEAVQDVAFVDDHVNVDESLYGIDEGLAVSDTVGAGGGGGALTVTITD